MYMIVPKSYLSVPEFTSMNLNLPLTTLSVPEWLLCTFVGKETCGDVLAYKMTTLYLYSYSRLLVERLVVLY